MTWTLIVIALVNGEARVAMHTYTKPYVCDAVAEDITKHSYDDKVKITFAKCYVDTGA